MKKFVFDFSMMMMGLFLKLNLHFRRQPPRSMELPDWHCLKLTNYACVLVKPKRMAMIHVVGGRHDHYLGFFLGPHFGMTWVNLMLMLMLPAAAAAAEVPILPG